MERGEVEGRGDPEGGPITIDGVVRAGPEIGVETVEWHREGVVESFEANAVAVESGGDVGEIAAEKRAVHQIRFEEAHAEAFADAGGDAGVGGGHDLVKRGVRVHAVAGEFGDGGAFAEAVIVDMEKGLPAKRTEMLYQGFNGFGVGGPGGGSAGTR